MALNHVHLKVQNIESTRGFYETHFGFHTAEVSHGESYLTDNRGSWITLSLKEASEPSLPSWFHFGFCLDSREEVTTLFHSLKSANLTFDRELTHFADHGTTFYVRDPEGNRVEVSWIKSRPLGRLHG